MGVLSSQKNLLLVLGVLLCGLISLATFDVRKEPVTDPVAAAEAEIADQEKFYRDVLDPLIMKRLRDYPVPSVRVLLVELINKLERDEIVLGHQGGYSWQMPEQMASAFRMDDGRRVIALDMLAIYPQFPVWQKEGIEEDVVAGVMLHEYFHILHHVDHVDRLHDTVEASRRDESEAWHFTCEQVLVPMLAAGRFPTGQMNGPMASAYNAYYLSHGDPLSPIWQEFIATVSRGSP